jgi:hypothetical protein
MPATTKHRFKRTSASKGRKQSAQGIPFAPAGVDRFEVKDASGRVRTLIWVQDGARLYGIPAQDIPLWSERPCTFTGRKLAPVFRKVWVPARRGAGWQSQRRCYVDEGELQEIAAARSRNSRPAPELPKDAPKDATAFAELQKRFPKATERRLMWAHEHRGLWVDKLPARDKAGDVRHLPHASLAEVKALLEDLEAAPGRTVANPYTDPSGIEWWPPQVGYRKVNVPPTMMGVWRRSKREHPALGRQVKFLKPKQVPAEVRRNHDVYYYPAVDYKRIGEWLKRTTALEQAKEFLLASVANGPVDSHQVKSDARKAGISRTTLQRAREALQRARKIKISRRAFQGKSYWHLPEDEPPAAPLVFLPHPKLDRALQILRSVPDHEAAFPELVERAQQEGISRTTMHTAREIRRQGVEGEGAPRPAGGNGKQIPDQIRQPAPSQPESSERQPSASEKGGDKHPAVDRLAVRPIQAPPPNDSDRALIPLLRVFTNGIVDERIKRASQLLADEKLSANEKLTKIDALIPFPPTASAEQMGEMLGVTRQAVMKTDWWIQNRKGEKVNEIGRRRTQHQQRAHEYEEPTTQELDSR